MLGPRPLTSSCAETCGQSSDETSVVSCRSRVTTCSTLGSAEGAPRRPRSRRPPRSGSTTADGPRRIGVSRQGKFPCERHRRSGGRDSYARACASEHPDVGPFLQGVRLPPFATQGSRRVQTRRAPRRRNVHQSSCAQATAIGAQSSKQLSVDRAMHVSGSNRRSEVLEHLPYAPGQNITQC